MSMYHKYTKKAWVDLNRCVSRFETNRSVPRRCGVSVWRGRAHGRSWLSRQDWMSEWQKFQNQSQSQQNVP